MNALARCAVALVLGIGLCQPASAVEVFDFTFATTVRGTSDAGGEPEEFAFPWSGTLSIETSSGQDGVYQGDDLVRMSFSANPGPQPGSLSFVVYGNPAVEPDCNRFYGCEPTPAIVTVANGAITSIELEYFDTISTTLTFAGLTVELSSSSRPGGPRGSAHGLATLEPVKPPIPEPNTASLLLAGLLFVGGFAMRRHRRLSVSVVGLV